VPSKINDLGPNRRKLHPKLRMFANRSPEVNVIRADLCSTVAVFDPELLTRVTAPLVEQVAPRSRATLSVDTTPRRLAEVPEGIYTGVFIETADTADVSAESLGLQEHHVRKGSLTAATVPLAKLKELIANKEVTQIEPAEPLVAPTPTVATARPRPSGEYGRALQDGERRRGRGSHTGPTGAEFGQHHRGGRRIDEGRRGDPFRHVAIG
jgi:hypothetical protein